MKSKNFILILMSISIVAEACSKTNQIIRKTENTNPKFRPLAPNKNSIVKSKKGFNRGLSCEKILGQCDEKNENMVKMKWKYRSDTDCVAIEKAKLICPQIVIAYLEDIVLDHYKKEFNERKNELDQCKSKLHQPNTELDQSNTELDQSNTELDQPNTELDQSNTKLHNSNFELEQYKSKLIKATTELDRLKSTVDEFKSKLDQSNTELVIWTSKLDQCIKSKFYYNIPVGLIPAGG